MRDETGPGGAIHVQPDELRKHAANLWKLSEEISRAESAAEHISMSHDAFGILIGFVGAWFQDKEQDLVEKFKQTDKDLMDDSMHLRGAVTAYEFADRQAAERANGAGQPLMALPL